MGQCTNPYSWTKCMLKQLLMDIQKDDPEWNAALLRYFNSIDVHPSGCIRQNTNFYENIDYCQYFVYCKTY